MHSNYSYDGQSSIKDIMKTCKNKGISGIAIVDHESVDGLKEAREQAISHDITLIPGFELKTIEGDVIALYVEELPKAREMLEVAQFIKDNNGLMVMPHPYRASKQHLNAACKWDAIEVLNGRSHIMQTVKAYRLANRCQASKIAGSDAHHSSELGRCKSGCQSNDPDEVRKIIHSGSVILSGHFSPITSTFRSVKRRLSKKHGQ